MISHDVTDFHSLLIVSTSRKSYPKNESSSNFYDSVLKQEVEDFKANAKKASVFKVINIYL